MPELRRIEEGFCSRRQQVAAGYCIYGPQTTLVLTVGDGVAMFTLDRERGSFGAGARKCAHSCRTPKSLLST